MQNALISYIDSSFMVTHSYFFLLPEEIKLLLAEFTARQDYFTHFEPVSHVTRARLEPTAARWRAIQGAKD